MSSTERIKLLPPTDYTLHPAGGLCRSLGKNYQSLAGELRLAGRWRETRRLRTGNNQRQRSLVPGSWLLAPHSAFTLLEIVLALAILAGALAALGEVMRLADRNSELTRDETQAQMLAESVMEELLAGARPLATVRSAVFDLVSEPRWEYSIAIEPTQRKELLLVRVAVTEQIPPELQPARFELVRWMPNPDYLPTSSSSSSSGSGTGGSSAFGDSGGSTGGGEQL